MTLAAIVLAAGSARRFGSDKLSAQLDGEPLVRHAIRAARSAPVGQVIVVARDGLAIGDWPGAPEVHRVSIVSDAMSASLKAGIAAAGEVDGAFVFLGDMPRIPHAVAGELAQALGENWAAVPRHQGHAGHPVLLSARSFAEIKQLTGDAGAGKLLKQRDDVVYVDCDDPGVLFDVDRPQDLTRA
ncbi:MAG: nucleotidyltransferase family protein [Novosphingobium sp.]|nr:nucleotidyltransferase family protein [Novosphingobium sp.]